MRREDFEIYDNDIFLLESVVTSVLEEKGTTLVILEKTPFRPNSGGQPSDTGVLENENFKGIVEKVIERDGKILHWLRVEKGSIRAADPVIAKIDVERRTELKQMHSGEHLFFGVLKKILAENNQTIEVEKIRLEQGESAFFVKTKVLNWEFLFRAEEIVNRIIWEGKDVEIHYLTPEHIDQFIEKGLRIKKDKIKSRFIRLIDFKGLDISACTGTHVRNTREIVAFIIKDFKNLGNERFEIWFRAGEQAREALFEFSREFRKISAFSARRDLQLFDFLRGQLSDRDFLKKKYYHYLLQYVISLKPEFFNDINFYTSLFENEESKVLIKGASKLCDEKTIVCLFNKKEDGIEMLILSSKDLKIDLLKFLNEEILKTIPGKGGGNAYFINATLFCSEEDIQGLMQKIKQFILNITF